eukprot:901065-Rhodomonas_salina.1
MYLFRQRSPAREDGLDGLGDLDLALHALENALDLVARDASLRQIRRLLPLAEDPPQLDHARLGPARAPPFVSARA